MWGCLKIAMHSLIYLRWNMGSLVIKYQEQYLFFS